MDLHVVREHEGITVRDVTYLCQMVALGFIEIKEAAMT